MILIRRPTTEPAELTSVRAAELARIRRDHPMGPPSRSELKDAFTVVAQELWQQQDAKCCYCEIKTRLQGNDVEHYRPASRYWWLAWTWQNLLFACPNCNRWTKNDKFPLADEANRLAAEQTPPGLEAPLLIDPSVDDPMQDIVYALDANSGHWLARARNGSIRGGLTVTLLKLNAQDLVEVRGQHVEAVLNGALKRIREAMARGDEANVRQRWAELTEDALQRTMPYRALCHDALDVLMPAAERARWGLSLVQPI